MNSETEDSREGIIPRQSILRNVQHYITCMLCCACMLAGIAVDDSANALVIIFASIFGSIVFIIATGSIFVITLIIYIKGMGKSDSMDVINP